MAKIAVFPGSFSPFTIGHKSIVERGLLIFDKIIIAVGTNTDKNQHFSIERRIQWIQDIYGKNPRIKISTYEGLTVKFCKKERANFIISQI